jgi:hypothetical protein
MLPASAGSCSLLCDFDQAIKILLRFESVAPPLLTQNTFVFVEIYICFADFVSVPYKR